jgi:outer membrane protein insertion porin family
MPRAAHLAVLALMLSVSIFAQTNTSPEKPFRLIAVNFKGLHEFKPDEVVAATGLKVGSMVVTGEFQTAANNLVATGAFAEVTFSYKGERGGYIVDFELQEAEKYLPVQFGNFVWVSDAELRSYLAAHVPLFHGRTTESGEMMQHILDALALWLGEHKLNGQPAYRIVGDANKQTVDAISFYVDGLRMPVRSVNFENAPNLTQENRDHLAHLLINSDYERSIAELTIRQSMEPIYQRIGYLRAKVALPTMKTLSETSERIDIALTYTIDEGKQYKISSLRWMGNTSVQTADLQKTLKLGPGSVADLIELRDNLRAAEKLYGKQGMLRANVEPKPAYDDASGTVAFVLEVTEGPVFKMGTFEITGLNPKEIEELRGRWKLKFGDRFNSDYTMQFLRDNVSIIQGRRAKIMQTEAPGNVVHLKLQFD